MKPNVPVFALAIASLYAPAFAQGIEARCREIAQREYPDDADLRRMTYDHQLSAARYMEKLKDSEVIEIALPEYPDDFALQKRDLMTRRLGLPTNRFAFDRLFVYCSERARTTIC